MCERPEHPRHLLVLAQDLGEMVSRADVMVLLRAGINVGTERADDCFVIGEQDSQHVFGFLRIVLAGDLLRNAGEGQEFRERAGSPRTERRGALCNFIHNRLALLVLLSEESMEIEEVDPDDVPVMIAQFLRKHCLVGEESAEDRDGPFSLDVREAGVGFLRSHGSEVIRERWGRQSSPEPCRPCGVVHLRQDAISIGRFLPLASSFFGTVTVSMPFLMTHFALASSTDGRAISR